MPDLGLDVEAFEPAGWQVLTRSKSAVEGLRRDGLGHVESMVVGRPTQHSRTSDPSERLTRFFGEIRRVDLLKACLRNLTSPRSIQRLPPPSRH